MSGMTHCWCIKGLKLGIMSALAIGGAIASLGNSAFAQLTPDTTLGAESSVIAPLYPQVDRIDGGAIRGSNLFHSFEEFSIGEGRAAYFANPAGIENILSRVTGSHPSHIFGKLGVLGNANLFLLNPQGIIFGLNARLDINGSFVGSTASSLKFADGTHFSATAHQSTPLLTVSVPLGLQFGTSRAGAIANAGNLAVEQGQRLTLVGGTVVSTGQLSAPGGQIVVASVPNGRSSGTPVMQLNGSGQISWDSQPATTDSSPPLTLSELLLGADASQNLELTVTASGEVKLIGSNRQVEAGDVVVQQLASGTATLLAERNLSLVESQLETTGGLNLLARDTVWVRDSVANPFIAQAGRQLLVQGDRGVDIFALNQPASGLFSGGDMILRSASTVGGDAHYTTGGNFRIEQLDGELGSLFSPYDPIIRASGDVMFDSYTGASLHILAGGGVEIPGNVRITGTDMLANSIVENVTLSNGTIIVAINGNVQPTFDIRAGTTAYGIPSVTGSTAGFSPTPPGTGSPPTSADIMIGRITNARGTVFLTNLYQPNLSLPGGAIQVGVISTSVPIGESGAAGSITIDSRSSITLTDVLGATTGDANSQGGTITLNAQNDITTANIFSYVGIGGSGNGGNISLSSTAGAINTSAGTLNSSSNLGNGGAIVLTAYGNIITDDVFSNVPGNGTGGTLSFTSSSGAINTSAGILNSISSNGNSGSVTFNAQDDITTGHIFAQVGYRGVGNGGSISLTSTAGAINTSAGSLNAGTTFGNGGAITLNAQNDIITADLRAYVVNDGSGNAGNLFLTSTMGAINTTGGILYSLSENGNGGTVNLNATDSITTGNIQSYSLVSGTGGAINIISTVGSIDTSASSLDSTSETGDGGAIALQALGDITIGSLNTSGGTSGGDITLTSSARVSSANSLIISDTFGSGKGGDVNIQASSVFFTEGTQVSASTTGTGSGGNLAIDTGSTGELILLEKASIFTEAYAAGNAGNLTINTGRLILQNGAELSTAAFNQGNGGDLTVNASESVELTGISADGILPSALTTGAARTGNAGNLTINTERLKIRDGAGVFTFTADAGQGGNLTVNASESVELSGTSADANTPSALSTDTLGAKDAGNLTINTGRLIVRDGAAASVSTFGQGQGGRLTVNASESVELSGTSRNGFSSGLYAQSFAGGDAGDLRIDTGELLVWDRALVTVAAGNGADARVPSGPSILQNLGIQIPVRSAMSGNAGSLTVAADSISLDNQGKLTGTTASGTGGNITLLVQDLILMRNNSAIATTAANNGTGGNITINAPLVVAVPKENSDIIANAFRGRGGNINITTQGVYGLEYGSKLTPLSDINASSEFGVNGTVQINTPGLDPSRGLTNLPTEFVDASNQMAQGCRPGGEIASQQSSFVATGRGGLPPNPREALGLNAVQIDWVTLNPKEENGNSPAVSTHQPSDTLAPVVEAQGWVMNDKGQVILTAYAGGITPHSSWYLPANCGALQSTPEL